MNFLQLRGVHLGCCSRVSNALTVQGCKKDPNYAGCTEYSGTHGTPVLPRSHVTRDIRRRDEAGSPFSLQQLTHICITLLH